MSNKFSWKDNWDSSTTDLDIFKEENNTTRNKKPIAVVPVTDSEYTDSTGAVGDVYKIAPRGSIPWGQIKFESYANVLFDNTYDSPLTKPIPVVALGSQSNVIFNNTYSQPPTPIVVSSTTFVGGSTANVIYTGTTYTTTP